MESLGDPGGRILRGYLDGFATSSPRKDSRYLALLQYGLSTTRWRRVRLRHVGLELVGGGILARYHRGRVSRNECRAFDALEATCSLRGDDWRSRVARSGVCARISSTRRSALVTRS